MFKGQRKIYWLIVFAVVTSAVTLSISNFSARSQQNPRTAKVLEKGQDTNQPRKQPTDKQLDDAAAPIVDLASSPNQAVDEKRKRKNKSFDNLQVDSIEANRSSDGLGHCTGSGCTPASSVMTPVVANPPSPANFNRTYGRSTVPTDCDNQTLQAADYPPCFPPVNNTCNSWDSNLCTCMDPNGGGGGGGGGDGGGGYYCTPYYWCYYYSWDGGQTWELYDMEYAGCW
ncbi:MAG TPA: hypothetical protein VGO91_10470 [Pyrinomonadaceae bacterium]|jgi:hypothetical protein|nr:hypothetical protein [Pyrinomonadaceae bacterium]